MEATGRCIREHDKNVWRNAYRHWEAFRIRAAEALSVWQFCMHAAVANPTVAPLYEPGNDKEEGANVRKPHSGLKFPFVIRSSQSNVPSPQQSLPSTSHAINTNHRGLRRFTELTAKGKTKISRQVMRSSRKGIASDPVPIPRSNPDRREEPRKPEDSTAGNIPDSMHSNRKVSKKRHKGKQPEGSTKPKVKVARTSLRTSSKRASSEVESDESDADGSDKILGGIEEWQISEDQLAPNANDGIDSDDEEEDAQTGLVGDAKLRRQSRLDGRSKYMQYAQSM